MPHRPGIGAIMGIVSEDGVASQKRVTLMDRSNLKVVARTTSDENGAYVFNGLNPDTNDYLVLAVDDDGNPAKEAIIRDYIQPIPAYQGATFMGNWEKRMQSYYPASGWAGVFDAAGEPVGVSSTRYLTSGPSVTFGGESLTPGAPHLGSILVAGSSIGFNPRTIDNRMYKNPLRCTMEWVFRRSSVPAGQNAGIATLAGSTVAPSSLNADDPNAGRLIASLIYDASTQTIKAYNCSSVSDYYVGTWGFWRQIGSADLSIFDDVVHLALVVEYGNFAKIFANGELIANSSLLGQNSFIKIFMQGGPIYKGVALCGSVNTIGNNNPLGRYTTVQTGPISVHLDYLATDMDVAARYADLMIGTTPAETGYAKEVLLDHPEYFYRLNEYDLVDGIKDWVSQNDPLRVMNVYATQNIEVGQSSPVTGGASMKFAGGAARTNRGVASSCSRRELTFEFIHEQVIAASAIQWIIGNTNDAETLMSGAYINGTTLYLRTREGSADVTYTFPDAITVGVRAHIAITLNKATQEAKLYINGELVQTKATTATLLDVNATTSNVLQETHIAGAVNDLFNGASNMLQAYLSEVAFYSLELPESRIKAHYDAMSVI